MTNIDFSVDEDVITVNKIKYWLALGILILFHSVGLGQAQSLSKQISWADSILDAIHYDQQLSSKIKSDLADSAFQIQLRAKDVCRQVNARIIQATHLDNLSIADSALKQLYWAHHHFQKDCDSSILMSMYRNFTNIYISLGELDRIDSISKLALQLWNPGWKKKDTRFAILNNWGIAKAMRNDTLQAGRIFHQALYETIQDNDKNYIQKTLINLGSLKGMMGDLDSAYYFLNTATGIAKEIGDMDNYMTLLINLGNVEMERKRYRQALSQFDSVFTLAEKLNSIEMLAVVQKAKAELYARMNDHERAYDHLKEFLSLNEQYLNEERIKAVTEMMEKYESERKARQIQQLEVDKLDASLKNEKITNQRNRFLFAGAGVLLIAAGLWTRLRYVRKSRAAIQHEKDVSDGLLLNILPASVADELKQKGFAQARQFDNATILFSDFKSFTSIAGGMNAVELVEEINICFKAFDEIISGRGIEKIKTIGDAYMAAGGVPETNSASAADVVLAALEMQRFIKNRKNSQDLLRLPAFEMRTGIHTGSVIAGIVGVKKFQYDLWGDTVNIASRMETNSEAGRVNISEATYHLLKDNPIFICKPRGKLHVKGKGALEMYFVENAKSEPAGPLSDVA